MLHLTDQRDTNTGGSTELAVVPRMTLAEQVAANPLLQDPNAGLVEFGRLEQVDVIDAEFTVVSPGAGDVGGATFDYKYTTIKDIRVLSEPDPKRKGRRVTGIEIGDETFDVTDRFFQSLQTNFGFSSNIFHFFTYDEVFDRIAQVCPNDRLRYTVQRQRLHAPRLLATSRPDKAIIQHGMLMETLERFGGERVTYLDGLVNSTHVPRVGGDVWRCGPDEMTNQFLLECPIDGYGKPAVFLSLLRMVCTNGAVARTKAFRTELNLGKGEDVVQNAIIRALDSFNHDEGYAALRDRWTVSAKSWASVGEANSLYRLLVSLHSGDMILGHAQQRGPQEGPVTSQILTEFHALTGDTQRIYGLANVDALSGKKQATLPVKCTVYDLLNMATEVATHRSTETGRQRLHAWVGRLLTEEYDMEGTREKWQDFRDFYAQTDLSGIKGIRQIED